MSLKLITDYEMFEIKKKKNCIFKVRFFFISFVKPFVIFLTNLDNIRWGSYRNKRRKKNLSFLIRAWGTRQLSQNFGQLQIFENIAKTVSETQSTTRLVTKSFANQNIAEIMPILKKKSLYLSQQKAAVFCSYFCYTRYLRKLLIIIKDYDKENNTQFIYDNISLLLRLFFFFGYNIFHPLIRKY